MRIKGFQINLNFLKLFLVTGINILSVISYAEISVSSASECSPVDLRSELGPVRSQGDIGWCYANATADILSYYYRNESGHKDFSALNLAFVHNQFYLHSALFEGGFVGLTIASVEGHGLCERSVEDDARRAFNGSLKSGLRFVQGIKTNYDSWLATRDPRLEVAFQNDLEKLRADIPVFRAISLGEFSAILAESTTSNFLENLSVASCRGRTFYPTTKPKVTIKGYYVFDLGVKKLMEDIKGEMPNRESRNISLLNEIDQQLSQQNIVGIAYFADFLTEKNPKLDGRHMSVLVGRRWNNNKNKCEYLVRNSWGPKCDAYTGSFKHDCENGNIWVSRQDLQNNLYGITYINSDQ